MNEPHIDSGSDNADSGAPPDGSEVAPHELHNTSHQHASHGDQYGLALTTDCELIDHGIGTLLSDSLHIGTPNIDSTFHRAQTTSFTCDPATEIGIVNEFLGTHLSEAEATYEAARSDWVTHEGTAQSDVGQLLSLYGVENHRVENAEVGNLVAELSLGHKVIVGVNSDALHDPGHPMHAFTQQAENHAIWITGFDASDPQNPKVIVNDSADPTGAGATYRLDTFLDAWHTSGYVYVATDHAPPHLAEHVEGFDEATERFDSMTATIREHHPEFLADSLGSSIEGKAPSGETGQHTALDANPTRDALLKDI